MQDCAAHQVGGEQSLGEDGVVELFLVEFRSKGGFELVPQGEQLGESVEIAVGLAGHAIGETLDFFLGEGVGDDDVLLENAVGVGGLEFAGLQFWDR